MEIYLQTGWLKFPFTLFQMKSVCVCVHRIIEIYSGRRNGTGTQKNPKAVYFVVIVTTDSFFSLCSRFYFFIQSIRDFTFDVNFICVTMYIFTN